MTIDKLEKLHAAATGGLWMQNRTGTGESAEPLAHVYTDDETVALTVWPHDTALIVAAVNALPALLRIAKAAKECAAGDYISTELDDALRELEKP